MVPSSRASADEEAGKSADKKSPAITAGLLVFGFEVIELVRRRRELRDQALVRLEGLLGQLGVKTSDLLRFRDEGFVGRARKLGLRFKRLVQRLHAGKLFNVGFGLIERLLGVIAIRSRDRLNAALQVARRSGNRFEMLLAVILNVLNLDHHGVLSQTA